MAVSVSADIRAEPLAVWDSSKDEGLFWDRWPETHTWAMEHIDDANSTYRVEFFLIDAPFAVVYRFWLDENGRIPADFEAKPLWPDRLEPKRAEPVVQMLDELPPAHLLGRRV